MKHVLKFRVVDRDKFDQIVNGSKTIETRASTPTYQKIKVGDVLVIRCDDQEIQKIVKKVEHFGSVQDIYNSPGFSNILPWARNLEDAEKTFYSFPGYREKIEKMGILAFYLDS